MALFRFTCVTVWIFNLARDDRLLASSAVAHSATVVEIEVVGLGQFEYALVVARPIEGDCGFLKKNVRHDRLGNRDLVRMQTDIVKASASETTFEEFCLYYMGE